MTKRPGMMAFVTAVNMTPKVTDVRTIASTGRTRSLPRRERAPKAARLEDLLFSEMERNQTSQIFSNEEIERMAHIFGLSAEEVEALYRPQD